MADPADIDELKSLVSTLSENVKGMVEGKVDESTVRSIVTEAMQQSRRAGTDKPEGFVPDDQAEDEAPLEAHLERGRFSRMSSVERFQWALETPAAQAAPALRRSPDLVTQFQRASDELVLLSAMTKTPARELDYYHDVYAPIRDQAMDTKTTGEGKELVSVEISTEFLEKLSGGTQILNLFPSITMPSNPFEFPIRGPRKHVALLAEAIEPGTPKAKKLIPGGPTKVSMTATKFAGEIVTSKELEEDAAIAILPFLEDELRDWLAADLEDAVMNGDAVAPHMDAGVAADDPRMGWNGLRAAAKAAGTEFDAGGNPLNLNTALQTRAKMGRYGLQSGSLLWIVPVNALYALLAEERLVTVDKYGTGATILSGEIGRLWGTPVMASDLIPTTLDATGVVPAVASTFSVALCVNASGFLHGMRRAITVQILTELYAESDQDAVMLTTRQAFTQRYAGEPVIAAAIHLGLGIPTLT